MTRVALIFPPATDPRSPHLPLPALAATLRKAGVRTDLLDLDLGGLLGVLRPARLLQAGKVLGQAGLAERLAEQAPYAVATLRHPVRFYDPHQRRAARATIHESLQLVSAAAKPRVHYSLETIRYDVEGIDPQRLSDLIRVTAVREANLFADYWAAEVYPSLDPGARDLIGVSISNRQQIIPGLTLARELRSQGHFVVIGGPLFTKFADRLPHLPEFFEHFADGLVVYEGETALLELLNQLQGKRDFARVPNFLYVEKGRVRATARHIEDLEALPPPDFDGLPLDEYLSPAPVLPILAGKGCYHATCRFCDISYSEGNRKRRYRVRSAGAIAADILWLHRAFAARHFLFTDECLPPRLLERLADALEPYEDLQLRFAAYGRFERGFTPRVCEKLARMGMRRMFFGLESGSQKTLDHMNKGIRLSDARPVLENCARAGIRFHVFSMIGLPEETEEEARKTAAFFVRNADVIDEPGNSLDIHPFEMQMQSAYARQASECGVQIAPETLNRDFVVGIGRRWRNTRGFDDEKLENLLDEFLVTLRRAYRHLDWPDSPWPALEEWGLLYADHDAEVCACR